MGASYVIIPYQSVGKIVFGMAKSEIEDIFGKSPDYVDIGFLGKTNMKWGNVTVVINKKGIVDEVIISFSDMLHVFLNDIDLLNDPIVAKKLNKVDKPENAMGTKVYYKLGIAMTGIGKTKDDKTVSIFSKELIKQWKKYTSPIQRSS
jgi:hypothetical protein